MSAFQSNGSERVNQDLITAVQRALAGLRYGSIEIVIHDSNIVQVERKERVRYLGNDQHPTTRRR